MKYIILVNLLTITLKWPLDAIWFKAQGKKYINVNSKYFTKFF